MTIAAIDAGSNAIRLLIAKTNSNGQYRVLKNERVALRLGSHVFSSRQFDEVTVQRAVEVFRRFKSLMNQHDVQRYRAVATSATREARNRSVLVDRIYRQTGIRLEVIDGFEEARLIRTAVLSSLEGRVVPRVVIDLGGGSMQINLLENGQLRDSASLSLGTVRLMEKFGIEDALTPEQVQCIQERVETQLHRFLPQVSKFAGPKTVLCGGNAEALALLAPGRPWQGIGTLDFSSLRRRLPQITSSSVARRMATYEVRKDRAEVMAIAAVILSTAGKLWGLSQALVPGVGLKEGVLLDVLHSIRGKEIESIRDNELLFVTRKFATRLGYDQPHCEHVADLAVSLFDQLKPLHRMGRQMRVVLQLSALLHDIGHAVGRESHHKVGEYLVLHGDFPGISTFERNMVACLVRYHSESEPDAGHKVFASLGGTDQRQVFMLVALLRVADRLDSDHRQSVATVGVRATGAKIALTLAMKRASQLTLWNVEKSGKLFQEQFERKLVVIETKRVRR